MKKNEYVARISEKLNIPKSTVQKITDEFISEMINAIASKDKISISNFGSFQKNLIQPKNQFSPIDGSNTKRSSYYRITFTCSENLIKKLHNK